MPDLKDKKVLNDLGVNLKARVNTFEKDGKKYEYTVFYVEHASGLEIRLNAHDATGKAMLELLLLPPKKAE